MASAIGVRLLRGRPGRSHVLRLALLCSISLPAFAAHAQDATWVGGNAGDANEWVEDANWNPAAVPSGTATFDNTGTTATVRNDNGIVIIGAVNFASTAPSYSITIENPFIVNGAGIANNSANAQTLTLDTLGVGTLVFQNSSSANSGTGAVNYINDGRFIYFENSSNAGSNTTFTNNGIIQFFDTSSGGSATITNNTGLDFFDQSSAANTNITNNATGTITFNNTSTAGNSIIANSGTVAFNNSASAGTSVFNDTVGTITFNNSASAGGSVINGNGDTVTFNDSSTAGTSVINNGGGGTVAFNGTSTADQSIINNFAASTTTFNDTSSAGSAIINALTGGGVFFIGNSSGDTAQFVILTGSTFDISGLTSAGTTAGSIQGAGNFFLGAKSLTVGSANTSTIVDGIIADGGASGGTGGSLIKTGTGMLTLTNTNTYTGMTDINGGTLRVDGSIATSSQTNVNSGGTLIGIGVVGDTSVNSGGVFAPGTPGTPGTSMTVAGNLTFQNGATYLVQVDPSTATLANITGSATLAGQVLAAFTAGGYMQHQYTILNASSLIGTFSTLATTNLPVGFFADLSYTGTDVFLNLTAIMALGGNFSGNQQNVANALNNFFNSGGMLPTNFVNVFALSDGNLATALSQLSGEAATGAQQGAFQLMTQFLGVMIDPFVNGRSGSSGGGALGFAPEQQAALPSDVALAYASVLKAPPKPTFERRWSAWGAAYGGANRTDGDPVVFGSNNLTARTYGFAGGMDYHFTPDVLAGFALAGGGTDWSLAQGLGGGRSDAFQAGVYGMARSGPAYVSAALAFTNYWMSTDRFAFAGDHLDARFNAQSYGGRLESGYRFAMPWIAVTPYAAVQAVNFHTPGYSERDLTGGGFALAFAARNATDTRSELGLRFDHTVMSGVPLTLRARVAWAHDWVSDPSLLATFQALPGASFIVNGATPAKDSLLASAGSELHLTPALSVAAKFDGEFALNSQTYAGTGMVRYAW